MLRGTSLRKSVISSIHLSKTKSVDGNLMKLATSNHQGEEQRTSLMQCDMFRYRNIPEKPKPKPKQVRKVFITLLKLSHCIREFLLHLMLYKKI